MVLEILVLLDHLVSQKNEPLFEQLFLMCVTKCTKHSLKHLSF